MERPVDSKRNPGGPETKRGGLARRAVIGAIWTIGSSVGSRAIGLVGTLLITRYLSPEIIGEASNAAVVVMTATIISGFGLGQYVVSRPKEGREGAFHATFYSLLLGAIALGGAVLLEGPISRLIRMPGIVAYVPLLAVAYMIERVATLQDRILVRDMRFREVSLLRSLGEIVYAVVSVVLAARWRSGDAIIWASMARPIVRVIGLSIFTPLREWFSPSRLSWKRTRDMFVFGWPMAIAAICDVGSRRWDNLLIGAKFGEGTTGIYNYAYNLADIPATQIGETIGDVLVPSFAEMDSNERRKRGLLLSMRMLILLVAPMAMGLAAIAPTLVKTLFDARWQPVAPMLVILSVLSVVRPIGWIGASYLQVRNKTRAIMALEITKPISLLGLIYLFENLDHVATFAGLPGIAAVLSTDNRLELLACGAVGLAFILNSLGFFWVLKRIDDFGLREQIFPLFPPVVACIPMVLAVHGVRYGLSAFALPHVVKLAAETLTGAIVFVPSALILAPSSSKEFLYLLKKGLIRRRTKVEAEPVPPQG